MMADRKRRLVQGAAAGALVGLLLSQYHPLWGDTRQLRADPWTSTRKTLGGPHVLLFSLLGLGLGTVVARARNE
jgi:hypothetical protein